MNTLTVLCACLAAFGAGHAQSSDVVPSPFATKAEAEAALDELMVYTQNGILDAATILWQLPPTIASTSLKAETDGLAAIQTEYQTQLKNLETMESLAEYSGVDGTVCVERSRVFLRTFYDRLGLTMFSCINYNTDAANTAVSSSLGSLNTVMNIPILLGYDLDGCSSNSEACINAVLAEINKARPEVARGIVDAEISATNAVDTFVMQILVCEMTNVRDAVTIGRSSVAEAQECITYLIENSDNQQ